MKSRRLAGFFDFLTKGNIVNETVTDRDGSSPIVKSTCEAKKERTGADSSKVL